MNIRATTIGKNRVLFALLAGILFTGSAVAGENHPVNVNDDGVAIHGYDPVAYFKADEPVEGKSKFTATHEGATYQFASRENLQAFKADPDHYAPRYGGYCAMGMSMGKQLDIDPAAYTIVDDELYLNLNLDVRKSWRKDTEKHISQANGHWKDLTE